MGVLKAPLRSRGIILIDYKCCTVRPAILSDSQAVAQLLVQLTHAQAPGVLVGSLERQRSLMRYTLESNHGAGLRERLVAETEQGIVGTAAAHVPGTPRATQVDGTTVRVAVALLGYRSSARLLFTLEMVQLAACLTYPKHPRSGLSVYGVSVDEHARHQGIGRALMGQCETIARQQEFSLIHLRVIVSNRPALAFYQHLGYQIIGRTPRWLDPLTFPTLVLQKCLDGSTTLSR